MELRQEGGYEYVCHYHIHYHLPNSSKEVGVFTCWGSMPASDVNMWLLVSDILVRLRFGMILG